MKKLNARGFSAVEGLLILVIVGIIGGAGWYVLNSKNENPLPANQTASTPAPKAVRTTYSKVPTTLQQAIFDRTKEHTPTCIKNNQIVDFNGNPVDNTVDYASSGSATTPIGCDGGAVNLFAKQDDGSWKFIAATQDIFTCSDLFVNKVPKELLELDHGKSGSECSYEMKEKIQVMPYDYY